MTLKIVADENIPLVHEVFSGLGDVAVYRGRDIDTGTVASADVLLVRSVTRVDSALVADSSLRFVGTCTIGEDHVDKACLREMGIGFSSAPGCNANSVAEYVVAALLVLSKRHGINLRQSSLGIVGVGHVGSLVARKATALGMTCKLHDPPLAERTGDPSYVGLPEIQACDILSFHVPLERGGPYPTFHMVDTAFLAALKTDAILINTARGSVVDNEALKAALETGNLGGAVLDVWEGEPHMDTELLARVDVGTPHIAGYSLDGKVNGTTRIYEAVCRYFDLPATCNVAALLPPPTERRLHLLEDPAKNADSGGIRTIPPL
jgi:erythronate-4-phosphate dehydrogenase